MKPEIDTLQRMSPARLEKALSQWELPPVFPLSSAIPARHQADEPNLEQLGCWLRQELHHQPDSSARVELERAALNWVCDFARLNVKRGRLFELGQVVHERRADCLAYAKLLNLVGRRFGLDIGIVEVVVDNAGRYVPHVASIARFADGTGQFVDLWYGSRDVHHLRLGLQVRVGRTWMIKDVNQDELPMPPDAKGLPAECVDAITYYIVGNRHLQRGLRGPDGDELARAISCYDAAIRLYPQNARFYFNRAVAYDNIGARQRAQTDYAAALKDEASRIRVLAREYEESDRLIALDEIGASPQEQQVYLLRRGLITGKQVSPGEIAARCGISPEEVEGIMSAIEAKLRRNSQHG